MPNNRDPLAETKEEPYREEPGNAIPHEGANEQDQDGPTAKRKKTFIAQ